MPVMDEFREEREALKNSSFKKKWEYFLDYYKWYVIGGALIIFFLVWLIRDMVNSKDWIFYGTFINSHAYEETSEAFINDFIELAELDTENYAVAIDDTLSISTNSYDEISMNSVQKLMIYIAASDVDFVAADETTFNKYATEETFFDLRTVLSEEQLAKYEQYFYYVDMAEVERKNEASSNGDFDTYTDREYDHADPSTMESPIPVGIYINNSEKLKEAYIFTEEKVAFGIPSNTKHLETSLLFLDYIFE